MRTSLDDVLITAELARRLTRTPDYEAENRALSAVAEAIAGSPQLTLQKLVETALDLCRADSAGISILEPGGTQGIFRWHAIAGQFAANMGRHVLREASPSGIVLDRDTSLLFSHPERHFDYGMAIDPPIVEALLVPFHADGKPVGTVWLIAHTPSRKFDAEDQRILTSLSRFAQMAYQVKRAAFTADRASEDVRQILDSAAVGLTRCSRDLRYVSCNPAYEKLVGLSAEQIIGRRIIDVIGIEAFEVKRPYVERVLRGDRVEYEEEFPFGGGQRFLHVVYMPWMEGDGQVVGWMSSISDITDLKRTTEALRESEERLHLAMTSGNVGFWDWDLNSGRIAWSRELEGIYGLDHAGSYEAFSSRVHPDDLAAIESEQNAAVRSHKPFDLEFRVILPSGEIRWLCSRGRGHYDENGRVVRVAGINIDITERVRAKEALQEREQRLRLALDASGGGSWSWDARTNRVDWDDRFRELYGFAPEEPAAVEAWPSRVHEEDRHQVLGFLNEILNSKKRDSWDNTFRIVRPNGTLAWIESLGRVERDAEGQVLRLTGIELDVTERRQSEEALEARRHEERERTVQRLLDTAPQGILSTDAQGVIMRTNCALGKMFGWTPDELIGRSVEELVPPQFRDRHPTYRTAYFEAPQSRPITLDLTGRRKDGSTFPIEISLNHVLTAAGGRAIVFVSDISTRKQAEEALRRSHSELERRAFQLRRLASDLTLAEQHAREELAKTLHDGIQQLLFSAVMTLDRAVTSNSQADQVALLQRARADIDEAMKAARTLSMDLFPPMLHMGGLPAALVWLGKRTQEQYRVVVNVTADPRGNPATSDVRILLFEAVRELLFNAVKHAHVGRVDVELTVEPDDTIHIHVSDEGVGFDPSGTLHYKNHQQVGLGLFSIEERLALFGGRLEIQSAPGKGARFSLTLPRGDLRRLAASSERHDGGWQERLVYDSADDASKPLRILIADDHLVARAGLRELLSEQLKLHVVGEAANGVEAISQAMALQPDVIVMDASMPQMNGIEATRKIHDTLPHIHIVGFSTHDDENSERSMRKAGAEAYFTKNEGTDRLLNYLLSV